jgi:hypothetical protein
LFSTNSVEIAGYRGGKEEVKIPETINNLPVAAVGDRAFASDPLTFLSIEATVTVSTDEAFPGSL